MGIFSGIFRKKANPAEPPKKDQNGLKYRLRQRIDERYEIFAILGEEDPSHPGIVYICLDRHGNNNVVALKTFKEEFLPTQKIKQSFYNHALSWVNLKKHPFIVGAEWVEELDNHLFIGCELVAPDEQGRNTLSHYLKSPIPLPKILLWSTQFCHAMEYATSMGVSSHGTITPDNIMITHDGSLKITDFFMSDIWGAAGNKGVEAILQKSPEAFFFSGSKRKKIVKGRPLWSAPELVDGDGDERSDIYSFGAILYRMSYHGDHELPVSLQGDNDSETAAKNDELAEIDPNLVHIICKCLRPSPENRYQSFVELRVDLERAYVAELHEKPQARVASEADPSNDMVKKGISLSSIGMVDAAIRAYQEALLTDPENASARYRLGIAFLGRGLLDAAISEFEKAKKIDPENASAHAKLGIALGHKDNLDEAIMELREALKIDPDNAQYHYNLGINLGKKGLLDEKIAEYKEAVRIQPEYSVHHYNLGNAFLDKGLITEAVGAYVKALKIDPEDKNVRHNLEIALAKQNL